MHIRVALIAMLVALPAAAQQNLVVNGSFDTDVAGWGQTNQGSGHFDWSSLDAGGSPASGSARVVNDDTAAFSLSLIQCVPVSEGLSYNGAATLYIPPGQVSSGFAYLRLSWTSAPACDGSWLETTSHAITSATGEWVRQSLNGVASPATAQAVQIEVIVFKTTMGGQLEVHVDDAVVVADEPLFEDGFENGDLAAWSAVVP